MITMNGGRSKAAEQNAIWRKWSFVLVLLVLAWLTITVTLTLLCVYFSRWFVVGFAPVLIFLFTSMQIDRSEEGEEERV